MNRVTVKIDHLKGPSSRTNSTRITEDERYAPDLWVIAHGQSHLEALETALRILAGERDTILSSMPITFKNRPHLTDEDRALDGIDEDDEV